LRLFFIYIIYLSIYLSMSQHHQNVIKELLIYDFRCQWMPVASGCPRYRNQAEEATDEKLQNIYPTNESYSYLVGNIQSLLRSVYLKNDPF
jgi:hypothetical protein